jgi:Holliday junction resolvase-like predicted endonuclease
VEKDLFFQPLIGKDVMPDVIVSENRGTAPWIAIEVKYRQSGHYLRPGDYAQLDHLLLGSGVQFAVLMTNNEICIANSDTYSPERDAEPEIYSLYDVTDKEAGRIHRLLKKPTGFSGKKRDKSGGESKNRTENKHSPADSDRFDQLLSKIYSAETNQEKKESLESLARVLLDSIDCLTCYENVRTASSEIDIIAEYRGSSGLTIFDETGRYILAECKNWTKSVGADRVRDFRGKIEISHVKLGLVFAKNGISGEHRGAEARREIDLAFQNSEIAIIVTDGEDLKRIVNGDSLYRILDRKLFNLRFGI